MSASILYKEYIIASSNGEKYLCVNHLVQRGESLHKILIQRGNLSFENFSVLQSLNPNIKNLNSIRAGESLLVPLKIIRAGEFKGQSSGRILIPFVTRKPVADLLKENSVSYKIKSGDTVSKLIFKSMGVKYGSKNYKNSIKLFHYLNPEIKNINVIIRGQDIKLPRSELVNKEWFSSLFNPDVEKKLLNKPKPVKFSIKKKRSKINARFLRSIARTLDGDLQVNGELYLPAGGNNIMNLSLNQTPMLQSENFPVIFFTGNGRIDGPSKKILGNFYKNVLYFNSNYADEQSSFYRERHFIFDHGIEAWVRFMRKYREKGKNAGFYEILTPGGYYHEPPAFLSLFSEKGVILPSNGRSYKDTDVSFIPYSTSERFCEEVLKQTGSFFKKDVSISFPYKGVQVNASANMAKNLKDDFILVDFARFYGDTINELKKIHMDVVQINGKESKYEIIEALASGLKYGVVSDPVFPEDAGGKEKKNLVRIRVPGILVVNQYSDKDRYVFFTELDSSKIPYPVLYYLGWLNIRTVFI